VNQEDLTKTARKVGEAKKHEDGVINITFVDAHTPFFSFMLISIIQLHEISGKKLIFHKRG
jgi:hypothetical protein